MKKAAFFSALLHGILLTLFFLGMPDFTTDPSDAWVPVALDLIEGAEEALPRKQEAPPKSELKSKSEPKTESGPKSKPKPKPKPEPAPQPKPDLKPAPEPKTDPKPKPAPEPKPKPKPKPKARSRPQPAPKTKASPKKKASSKKPLDDFESVLKDLSEMKERVAHADQEKEKADLSASSHGAQNTSPNHEGHQVTRDELEAVRRHIQRCWNVPAGVKEGGRLVVKIRLLMNPDGTVREARVLPSSRSRTDLFYRMASESALRAVQDRRCQPFPLPPQKYNQWKVFVISFDPKDVF